METETDLTAQTTLSPTCINSYFRCPKQYFYSYIAKLELKPSIHLVKGTIMHTTLEYFYKKYESNLRINMLKIFEDTWTKNGSRLKILDLSEEQLTKEKLDCVNMLDTYLFNLERKIKVLVESGKAETESHAFHLVKPKFRELKIEDEELHCKGFIDRIDEDFNNFLTLGDYKTSSKYGIGLGEDYRRQMAIYALLYERHAKRMPDFLAVIFLRYGETLLLEVSPSTLKYARDAIEYTYAKTRSTNIEDYPLKENSLCRWCNFFSICNGEEDWKKAKRLEKFKKVIADNAEEKLD